MLEREHFWTLFGLYTLLFICLLLLIKLQINWKKALLVGLLFRGVLLVSMPNLSQDFYRFIWDGEIVKNGMSPYEFTPNEIVEKDLLDFSNRDYLITNMGALSASNYSNYPPFNQYLFWTASTFSLDNIELSVFIMRIQIIIADLLIFFMGIKLLEILKLDYRKIYLYYLNPFIILELGLNLHYEGIMILFLLSSLLMIQQKKIFFGGLLMGLSISVKLLPLLILPLFIRYLGVKKVVLFYITILVVNLLLLVPFLNSSFMNHYLETIGLWFNSFEFNASIYYFMRWIGIKLTGYNQIAIIGKIIGVLSIALIIIVSFRKNNQFFKGIITNIHWVLVLYFLLATTVHPWYLVTPLMLSVFINESLVFWWSFLIFLSYYAYSNVGEVEESNIFLILEYTPIFTLLLIKFANKIFEKNLNEIT